MKLVTADQMYAIENSSVQAGVSIDELMENAGFEVASAARDQWDKPKEIFGKRITILIGPGNNGSDGFIAGRYLSIWGAKVTAALCSSRDQIDLKRELAEQANVKVIDVTTDLGRNEFTATLKNSDLVIDAVFGTGKSRPIESHSLIASILFDVAKSAIPIIALDLPTGLNPDTGEFDVAGLPADLTLMLGYPKLGVALSQERSAIGQTSVLDIGIPHGLDLQVPCELITEQMAAKLLPARPTSGHKNTFGSTTILAGSQHYLGAVTMATEAAVRSGNGLTFVATPDPAYIQIAGNIAEAMYTSLPTTSNGDLVVNSAVKISLELITRASSVVIGPGLGNDTSTAEFLYKILENVPANKPLVLDADALNMLSKSHLWWQRFSINAALTPHPGELSRLMKISISEIQSNRIETATEAARMFNKVVILKGAATVIASPDGRSTVSPWTNAGLAQGGSGDALAGLLGGLLAQSPSNIFEMATLSVYIHGYAAEKARKKFGETGMRITDIIRNLGLFHRDISQ